MSDIQKTISDYMRSSMSGLTMLAFAGMLETGEATMDDFAACGVDLREITTKYGAPNCWTGTTGSAAAALRRACNAVKR
jgi:hypothetical protein